MVFPAIHEQGLVIVELDGPAVRDLFGGHRSEAVLGRKVEDSGHPVVFHAFITHPKPCRRQLLFIPRTTD